MSQKNQTGFGSGVPSERTVVFGLLLLIAGGSGACPLMAMLRHRTARGSHIPTRFLYSARALDDVIYRGEHDDLAIGRGQPASSIDADAIADIGSQHLYLQTLSPGGVLRCRTCEAVLTVVVHSDGRYRLGLQGLKWIEVIEGTRGAAEYET